jgi:hypothetical protein
MLPFHSPPRPSARTIAARLAASDCAAKPGCTRAPYLRAARAEQPDNFQSLSVCVKQAPLTHGHTASVIGCMLRCRFGSGVKLSGLGGKNQPSYTENACSCTVCALQSLNVACLLALHGPSVYRRRQQVRKCSLQEVILIDMTKQSSCQSATTPAHT